MAGNSSAVSQTTENENMINLMSRLLDKKLAILASKEDFSLMTEGLRNISEENRVLREEVRAIRGKLVMENAAN